MTDIDTTTTDTGLSRRSLLAKLGVGTAVAWATPVIATVGIPAGAVNGPNQNTACRENAKDGRPTCAICDPPRCFGDACCFFCFCVPTVQQVGCCFCTVGDFINPFGPPEACPTTSTSANCNRDNQCPTGWRCVYNCNCPPTSLQFKGRCVPPCIGSSL